MMTRIMTKTKVILLWLGLTVPTLLGAQTSFSSVAQMDKTVHDFGDVLLSDGPLKCSFTLKNISDKPIVIYSVISSCGCTDVQWTKEPLRPSAEGTISATYSNDEGPYPFDKTLTVYVSGLNLPIILKIKGASHQKKEPLDVLYTCRYGNLAFKESTINVGNMDQGNSRSGEVTVANLGGKPLAVSFSGLSPQLSVKVEPNPVPAKGTSKMYYTVVSDRTLWGRNTYVCTPLVSGKSTGKELYFTAITKENFSNMSKEQKALSSRPTFRESTHEFGKVKAGSLLKAEMPFVNEGKDVFKVYSWFSEAAQAKAETVTDTPAGGKGTVTLVLDTKGLEKGDFLITVSLVTNSPYRPILNLFLAGTIE